MMKIVIATAAQPTMVKPLHHAQVNAEHAEHGRGPICDLIDKLGITS